LRYSDPQIEKTHETANKPIRMLDSSSENPVGYLSVMKIAVSSRLVERIIEKYTSECGEYVDIDAMCEGMGIETEIDSSLSDSLIGEMTQTLQEDDKPACTIRITDQADVKEQRTIKALLLAKFFLSPEKLDKHGYKVEVFEVKDLRNMRHSRLIYLATRLIMPESIITKVDAASLNKPDVKALSLYEERLVMCAVKGHTVALIVSQAG
jgi:hypothetical protein